ncbi:unnamed protein product [Clonostachys byssicola]|uniref:DUF7587 domain-containing protein n=1 Tax=Clonostachys byssicola TaxID=160290 RepID=A0A9N9UMC1_9HYPO|nr:unnamed protein product [Clonostachys byssicola]
MHEPMISAGADLDDDANMTGEVNLADHPEVAHRTRLQSTLTKTILTLNQIAAAAFQQGQQVLASGSDAFIASSAAAAEISLMHRKVEELADAANDLIQAMEQSIYERVILLGGERGPGTDELLEYFDQQIMENVRNVLLSSRNEVCVLWRIAEECYHQSIRPDGRLGLEDYYYLMDGAAEESDEHKNRVDVDEHYAELDLEAREARTIRERQGKTHNWLSFWVRALNSCPDGPTLFFPPAASSAGGLMEGPPFEDIPRYLFRVFDSKSSGKTDDNIVASAMSVCGNPERSRIDILSLETHSASEMLYNHLVKGSFDGSASDNLMSWSSSLMCAIQYAIWRSHIGNLSPGEVRVCAIDTEKFPPGQFVRDMTLLKAFNNTELSEDQKQFFRFRLENPEYDNGEYLSQGVVNHGISRRVVNFGGQSCTFSLQDLVEGGLYELYPEFGDTAFGGLWETRVRDLRSSWDTEQEMTRQEIYHAFNIARNCSGSLSELDIALLLLTFKNRKLKVPER